MRDLKQMIITVVVLVVICSVAAGTLAWVNGLTAPRIEEAKARALQAALGECLVSATDFVEDQGALARVKAELDGAKNAPAIDKVYRGTAQGQDQGYVFTVNTSGYASVITLMVGINADGQMEKVKVLSQAETPGLGTKIKDEQFIGQSAFRSVRTGVNLAVTKDGGQVQAIAGATVSSRAVVRAINQALTAANVLLTKQGEGGLE